MDLTAFASLSPTAFADVLARDRVMDHGIRPVWGPPPRVAGPAFPVRCGKGDSLMLQAAVHLAPAGSVVVADAGDCEYAACGAQLCAWAQARGIAALVVDGVVRDVTRLRELGFPVFARGILPIAGTGHRSGVLNGPTTCGGVRVAPGDIVVADEEGVVVIEAGRAEEVLRAAEAGAARGAALALEDWASAHAERVGRALQELGYTD